MTAFVQPVAADVWHFEDVERVVALSDIHGAYDAMVKTLQSADVIDDTLTWSSGNTHLVIVGDILDRGPDSRDAMDLLMRLEGEAVTAGGQVHVLIGNHEAMNIAGDLRYVSLAEYAAFSDEESQAERDHWFSLYRSMRASKVADAIGLREFFDTEFPPGFFAHRRAFAVDGKYGKWLLSKPVIVVINGTAFVHGGLAPSIAEIGLQGVNEVLVGELNLYMQQLQRLFGQQLLLPTDDWDSRAQLLSKFNLKVAEAGTAAAVADVIRLGDSDMHARDGPLWYRGNVDCNEVIEAHRLQESLRTIAAHRVVIGHTPTTGRKILQRFEGRIIEVDTGMLREYYRGSGNALIIEQDRLYTVSQDSAEQIPVIPHPRLVGTRPGGPLLAEEIEVLLQSGTVTGRSENEAGQSFVTVGNSEYAISARFIKRVRRGIYPEVAAYRLDRLLKFDMVPVTVKRAIDGDEGSLQFLPIRWVDEQLRQKKRAGGGAWCPLPDQWGAMQVFDVLAGNWLRSAETMRYSTGSWRLMLVGHERSFSTSAARPQHIRMMPLQIGPAWTAALTSLSDEVLQERFADVLDKRRIKALGKRRDLLLKE